MSALNVVWFQRTYCEPFLIFEIFGEIVEYRIRLPNTPFYTASSASEPLKLRLGTYQEPKLLSRYDVSGPLRTPEPLRLYLYCVITGEYREWADFRSLE